MKTKPHKLTLSQIIDGYLLAASARRLSPNTVECYKYAFKSFMAIVPPDTLFLSITTDHIKQYLSSFTTVTTTTILKYYISLSALWTWAVRERLATEHIIHQVQAPKAEAREILPLVEKECKDLLNATGRSKAYDRPGKRKTDHGLIHVERNRAILLLLIDTGLRATELCSLKIVDVDQRNHRVRVLGKGALERSVPFSPRTAQALWRYLATRPDANPSEQLLVTVFNRPLDRGQLAKFLNFLGSRAGIKDVHPHRFRHTFAIQYLRNGGDPYTLQKLLGHSTLEMVKRYLSLAQVDIDTAHKRASPVDNWAL